MRYDGDSFRTLVERHQSMVYSIALRITCDPQCAEEVAQDAFVSLYRAGRKPESEDHLRSWLRKTVTHGAIDATRRRKRQPEHRAEEWVEQDHPVTTLNRADLGPVENLLATLPEPQRVALVLRYGEDMLPNEIAVLVNQPVATVKSHLQRGLAMLRRKAAVPQKEVIRG